MAQHDLNILNQGFPSFRSDLNSALEALATLNSGPSSPSFAFTGNFAWWYDTTNNILKMRNADSSAWIDFAIFDQATGTWQPPHGRASGHNLVINGSGKVNARNYVSGTTRNAGEYTLDRWRMVTTGQSVTWTGNNSVRTMTAPAGGVEQVIEADSVTSGTYVINWVGTATCQVNGVAIAKGGTFVSASNTPITVRMIGGTFTDVQVEKGTVPTPFQERNQVEEVMLCQRYYQIHDVTRIKTVDGANIDCTTLLLPTAMRATPTVTTSPTLISNVASLATTGTTNKTLLFNMTAAAAGFTRWTGTIQLDAEI